MEGIAQWRDYQEMESLGVILAGCLLQNIMILLFRRITSKEWTVGLKSGVR